MFGRFAKEGRVSRRKVTKACFPFVCNSLVKIVLFSNMYGIAVSCMNLGISMFPQGFNNIPEFPLDFGPPERSRFFGVERKEMVSLDLNPFSSEEACNKVVPAKSILMSNRMT